MSKKYNEDSIHVLSPLEGIRTRLSMYIGGNDNKALHHVVKEIISNSIDEHLSGHGDKIYITVNEKENWVEVSDEGRGIPHGSIEQVFTKLHSSAKIKAKNGESYGSVGGLNGVGLKTSTASGKVEVQSRRGGKCYKQNFHYEQKTAAQTAPTKQPDGTTIRYTPDQGVFTDNQIRYSVVEELLMEMSYLLPKIEFHLTNGKTKVIQGKPIEQFIEDNYSNIVSPIITIEESNDLFRIKLSMAWVKGNDERYTSFVNMIPNEDGGSHITAFKTTMTRLYNKKFDGDLTGGELRSGLRAIVSLQMEEEPVFKGQDKSALNMNSINTHLNELYRDGLEQAFGQHEKFLSQIKEIVEKQRKKEKAMEKVREMLMEAKAGNKTTNAALGKLKPALNKKDAELIILEGDSAAGSAISERNIYTQAIMPLKGKIINSIKNDLDRVLSNEEVKDIIKTLGGFGEEFKAHRCPYSKIIFCLDSDSDGSHIQILLLGFFMKFYPELVKAGMLYNARTPLFIIKNGTKKEYIYTESEMNKRKKTLSKSALVSRVKGIGELNPQMLAESVLNPDTRTLQQITMADQDATWQKIEDYLGLDGAVRREIAEGGD